MSLDLETSLNHIQATTVAASVVGSAGGIITVLTQDYITPTASGSAQNISGAVLFSQKYVPPGSLLLGTQILVKNAGTGLISGVGVYDKNTATYTNMFTLPAAVNLASITSSKTLVAPSAGSTFSPGDSNGLGTAGLSNNNLVLAFSGVTSVGANAIAAGGNIIGSGTFQYYTPLDVVSNANSTFGN